MVVKVIINKSKVLKGILEESKRLIYSLLFNIHQFRSFLFVRKNLYL